MWDTPIIGAFQKYDTPMTSVASNMDLTHLKWDTPVTGAFKWDTPMTRGDTL